MTLLISTYSTIIPVLLVYFSGWFIISLIKRRNDVADIAWGLGFCIVAWTTYQKNQPLLSTSNIATILVTIWAVRLSTHIYFRNRTKTEDYRYRTWREVWGKWFYIRSFLQVFIFQGILLLIISTPILIANTQFSQDENIVLKILGIGIWSLGFFFETVGDRQLSIFIKNKNNQGKILTTGLWKYSRHPNYFGEITQWWALWILTLSHPYGWAGIIGPLTITFLILKVSGIPLLEKKMERNPNFNTYKEKTSILFPLPPKK